MKLSLATLDQLPGGVGRPGYDRAALSPGILHFGVGNFHRAHQAEHLDRLFGTGCGQDWAIVGAGVMAGDAHARAVLEAQDWLSVLVEQEADASTARVTGAMVDYLPAADAEAICARMAEPDIRIVSLTITEGGYFLDAEDRFDPDHPAMRADAAAPDAPKTVFGMILKGLRLRRAAGHAPFTIMCCDNIPHNGAVTKATLTGLARLSDPAFADWVAETVAFPNAMVDRITPATSDRERALCRDVWGIEDGWPVFCESFTQWVLEDDFPAGRPPLEEVGVQFVPDVTPYELMKIRILNGGHAVIAYPAGLLDVHFVHEAMEHPLVNAFLAKVEREEILPGVPPVPETDVAAYLALIERRFANPKIGDTVRRLCLDGSNRQPKFILPSVADALGRGGPVEGLALASALWCRYCAGTTDSGAVIAPNDPNWDRLTDAAQAARTDPQAWLGMREVYGTLGEDRRFADPFGRWLDALWTEGTAAVLARYTGHG
ncbi:mannitol dehydrogenase family protein [Roseivivax isoporae]|uniref:Mannitol 2-dehydrogenase n=1 Tax=Roseivivax isoporae LMG 25204 TaxID=1449351 RepID=X7FAF1_9RHOB|nr:mannitol dehydrogenase family protein [Roseivivax isoporae]ETX29790.1 mannitol 2-dehydrogenase [Roseivivax isoporae LMG 25204]